MPLALGTAGAFDPAGVGASIPPPTGREKGGVTRRTDPDPLGAAGVGRGVDVGAA